jgi:xylan 1,4-beta-xylosidase
MHRLGDQQLRSNDAPVMATRRADGSLAVLVWNLIPRDPAINPERVNYLSNEGACLMLDGPRRTFQFKFQGLNGRKSARVTYVDDKRGCAVPAWRAMGSPQYPTKEQIQQLRAAGELQPAGVLPIAQGNPAELTLELPPEGIALLEFDR